MFHFNVSLTERDYYEFNKFIALHSVLGKKQMRQIRILIALLSLIIAITVFLRAGGPIDAARFIASFLIAAVFCAVLQAILKPLTLLSLKMRLKQMKKTGKLSYHASAELTFGEESVCETTPSSRSEEYYQAIERICYLPGRIIYLFTDLSRAYLLPVTAFASQAELESFLTFIEDHTGRRAETFQGKA
ncbi:MAG: hypothetical protein IJL26_02340 [Clostridia bacterium]|nr:hypothetical protein [Clostridia bacterium]